MALDIEALRADVLKEHNVALDRHDPIFATVALNERVLAHYAKEMAAVVQHARDEASAGTVQQLEVAKATAEKLVTEAGGYIRQQTEDAFKKATDRLLERLDSRLIAVDRAKRTALGAAVASILVLCLVVGLSVGQFLH